MYHLLLCRYTDYIIYIVKNLIERLY